MNRFAITEEIFTGRMTFIGGGRSCMFVLPSELDYYRLRLTLCFAAVLSSHSWK